MKNKLRTLDQNELAAVNGGMSVTKAIDLFQQIKESGLAPGLKKFLRREVRSRIDD